MILLQIFLAAYPFVQHRQQLGSSDTVRIIDRHIDKVFFSGHDIVKTGSRCVESNISENVPYDHSCVHSAEGFIVIPRYIGKNTVVLTKIEVPGACLAHDAVIVVHKAVNSPVPHELISVKN